MPTYAHEIAAELRSRNDKEIQPVAEELTEYAEANPIYIFNVSPYEHKIEHPSVGALLIPGCQPGEKYSKPAIVKGLMPYGVCVDMKEVEIRHDSGRLFALDVLGLGPFRDQRNSLMKMGVFIASGNTLDLDDRVTYKSGPKSSMNVPRWVKKGKCPDKPTTEELTAANKRFEEWDWELIHQGDKHWDEGPGQPTTPHLGHGNISSLMREAARRRGQTRPWDQPIQSLVDCPGCGDKVKPNIIRHSCGYIFDMKRAVAGGMIAPPEPKARKAEAE